MEEGRRMFQIFAARMFEQRVLTAYREKVAADRQRKLLEELDEEDRLDTQREAKKAREAAKKKEKKRLQKQVKDEEKAKKDVEKAAQEAAVREAEEKKLEDQRQRKEDQRKKREAEKKAAEEDRLRKEAEKHRKQQEARERQVELERKAREAKERERQKRDEVKKKEREERELKEREIKEQKAKEERERKVQEDHARKQKEATSKMEKDSRDRTGHHQPKPQPVALPPGLQPPSRGPSIHSPLVAVATPAMPTKVPTPVRNRQSSQPGPASHGSSPRSLKASTEVSQSSTSSATNAVPQTPVTGQPAKTHGQPPPLHHPQPSAPRSPLNNHGRGQYPFHANGIPGLGVSGPPMGPPGMIPNMIPPMMYQPPPMINHQRFAQNGLQYPPGFARGPFQPGQQMPFLPQPPSQGPPIGNQPSAPMKPHVHSRQPSNEPVPIGRPSGLGPIARPSSTTPDKQKPQHRTPDAEMEQLTTQLGSKALLDDSDAPFDNADPRANLAPVGPPGSTRLPFANSFPEHKQEPFGMAGPGWGGFNPGMGPGPNWGPPGVQRPSPSWGQPPFGSIGSAPQLISRSHLPRPISVRLMLVQACRQLSQIPAATADGYHPAASVLRQLEILKVPGEASVSMDEMLGICDTEGNSQNGGGSFEVIMEPVRGQLLKYVEDAPSQPPRSSVGEIGSPILGHSQHVHHTSPMGSLLGQPVGPLGHNSNFGPPGRSF